MINEKWKNFLARNHANIINDDISDFGNVVEENVTTLHGNIITCLSHLNILRFTGKDAVEFLHNLFTTDIKQLNDDILQLSAWCNARGQVVCNFYLFKQGGCIVILIEKSLKELFINKLKLYMLRSEVYIEEERSKILTGIKLEAGSPSIEVLSGLPETPATIINSNDLTCIRLRDKYNRYIIIGEFENIVSFWQATAPELKMVGNNQWKMLDIMEGVVWITEKTSEQYLPQFINLDYLDAINFHKGCYPGQEIIARLHYRSKPGKRTWLLKTNQVTGASIGDRLHMKSTEIPAGRILNIEKLGEDNEIFLAVIDKEAIKEGDIYIEDYPEISVTTESLPYIVNR